MTSNASVVRTVDGAWRHTVLIGAIALAVGLAMVDHYHVGVFHDDAMYVILARSLATGQGYRYLNLPDAPVASHFPPGYPAILSLLWRIAPAFPANVALFKLFNALLLVPIAILVARLARERLESARVGVIAGLLTSISVPLLVLVTMVLSEPLFLMLVLIALIVGERLVERGGSRRAFMLVGVLSGAAMLVRAHGIALVIAVLVPLARSRRWKDAITVGLAAFATVLPWQLWSAANSAPLPAPLAGNYGSYVFWWTRGFSEMGITMIPATLGRTIPEMTSMLASLFSPMRGVAGYWITMTALGITTWIGITASRTKSPVLLGFLAAYVAIVVVWPFPPSRFIWGIWPLLLLVLIAGAQRVMNRSAQWPFAARIGAIAAGAWIACGYAAYELRAVQGRWWSSISRSADGRIASAVDWAATNTAPGDIIAADDEGALFLYTGRKSVPVASFTTAHYLSARSASVEANEGLVALHTVYPIHAVLVGSQRTFDAAQYLTTGPMPLLALRHQFPDGAAFTVISR